MHAKNVFIDLQRAHTSSRSFKIFLKFGIFQNFSKVLRIFNRVLGIFSNNFLKLFKSLTKSFQQNVDKTFENS